MLWHNGHGIVLDHQVGQNAFIADAGRPHAAIHLLDASAWTNPRCRTLIAYHQATSAELAHYLNGGW
jgi:hypothetical protein